jgi:uncharacterized protein (TIGR00375 family)
MAEYIADLQIHSPYSRATSKNISIESLAKCGKLKGLNLIGTGDFAHPFWYSHIKQKLKPIDDTGIFQFENMNFMLTNEVSTIYTEENKTRKIHHLIFVPNFEIVDQIIEQLSKKANLQSDGRPILSGVSSPELVDMIIGISKDILIIPAHVWTSWFGALGEFSGFNSLEECYKDRIKYIYAFETGLSSSPPMNWAISKLDKFTIVSFSDAHSANPWRLGREFTVFDLKKLSYAEIFNAIKNKDKEKIAFTGEVPPDYGKYHFDGHRNCKVSLSPEEAKKFNSFCPVCKKKLTIGVLHRTKLLADREEGFVPKDAIPFKTLLPLYEIISYVLGVNALYSKKVLEIHDRLIDRFSSELNVIMNVSQEELTKVCEPKVAEAIIKVREGKIKYEAGYDGVYGKPIFEGEIAKRFVEQKSLGDFKK